MKITTEKLMIWAKRAVLVLALAVTAGVILPSCEKEIEQHDEVIWYYYNNNNNHRYLHVDTIRRYATDKSVRNIYITVAPNESFTFKSADAISSTRRSLQERMDISPKVHGRGNFDFKPGVCTYGDSMDFVKMGFTINQQNR